MPDILADYERYKEKMICSTKDSCRYDENGYSFIYKDGIADLIPPKTLTGVPEYIPKSVTDPQILPATKEPKALKIAVIATIILVLFLIGIFFIYEVYYVYLVPLFKKLSNTLAK